MSPYDQKIKQLIEAAPSWEKDGGGIRGRTIAPLLGGSMGSNAMEESLPQQFNQQTNRSFAQQEENLPDLILPAMGGGDFPSHPWKITIRTVPESDPPEYEYAIESASRLFNGFGGTEVDVVGADGVFRPVEEGFYFIEVEFTDGEIDQAEIKITEDMGASVETEGGKQTKLKQQIGYVYFEDEVPKIRQYAWHNYSLFDVCRDGGPVKITIAT